MNQLKLCDWSEVKDKSIRMQQNKYLCNMTMPKTLKSTINQNFDVGAIINNTCQMENKCTEDRKRSERVYMAQQMEGKCKSE